MALARTNLKAAGLQEDGPHRGAVKERGSLSFRRLPSRFSPLLWLIFNLLMVNF
jgi:hypothetical protein